MTCIHKLQAYGSRSRKHRRKELRTARRTRFPEHRFTASTICSGIVGKIGTASQRGLQMRHQQCGPDSFARDVGQTDREPALAEIDEVI